MTGNRRVAIGGLVKLLAVRLLDLGNRIDGTDPVVAAACGVDARGWHDAAVFLVEHERVPPVDYAPHWDDP